MKLITIRILEKENGVGYKWYEVEKRFLKYFCISRIYSFGDLSFKWGNYSLYFVATFDTLDEAKEAIKQANDKLNKEKKEERVKTVNIIEY